MATEPDILDAIDKAELPVRGTLRAWMEANHAAFASRLVTRRPNWVVLAEVFVKAGLLDARGKPPTAEATRKTWYRVLVDLRKATARTTQQPAQPPVPAPRPPSGVATPTDDEDRPTYVEPRHRFHSRPGVPRALLPKPPTKDEPEDA